MSPTRPPPIDGAFDPRRAEGGTPDHVAHLWGVTPRERPDPSLEASLDRGFYSLVFLARALGAEGVEVGEFLAPENLHAVGVDQVQVPGQGRALREVVLGQDGVAFTAGDPSQIEPLLQGCDQFFLVIDEQHADRIHCSDTFQSA